MTGNVCRHCGKDLTTVKEIHVVEGDHFCSRDHAIEWCINDTILNVKEGAIQWYEDKAEIVTPQDIGLVYEKKWVAYSKDTDVTTIFLSRALDKDYEEVVSTEVIGFYFGEPDESSTETFTGQLKATY